MEDSMRALISMLCAASVAVAAPTSAQDASVEPAARPEWSEVARDAAQILRNSFYDPDSLKVEWVSGFAWGYWKPVIGRRKYGWIACGNYNAKNRMGGYAGVTGFDVIRSPDGKTVIHELGDGSGTCRRGLTPVNPELIAATSDSPQSTASVADELTKLADLLDRGLITIEEFNAQKAKLLAQ
jgi:hypothetical protein